VAVGRHAGWLCRLDRELERVRLTEKPRSFAVLYCTLLYSTLVGSIVIELQGSHKHFVIDEY